MLSVERLLGDPLPRKERETEQHREPGCPEGLVESERHEGSRHTLASEREGPGPQRPGPLLPFMHPSAGKGRSQKFAESVATNSAFVGYDPHASWLMLHLLRARAGL